MQIFLLSHTDSNGCLRDADTKLFLSMNAACSFLGDRSVDGDENGRWKITEHSVAAKPSGKAYILRHFWKTGSSPESDAEVYPTVDAAKKDMNRSRHEAERQWEGQLGGRYELAEWDVDEDSAMVYLGSDLESWKIREIAIPAADVQLPATKQSLVGT